MGKKGFNILERKFILLLGDIVCILITLKYFFDFAIEQKSSTLTGAIGFYTYGVFIYLIIAYVLNHYNLEKSPFFGLKTMSRLLAVSFFYTFIVFMTSVFVAQVYFTRLHVFIFFALTPLILLLWRYLFNFVFKFSPVTKRVLYVYDKNSKKSLEHDIEAINGKEKDTFYKVDTVHFIKDFDEYDDEFISKISNIDTWIVNTKNYSKFHDKLRSKMLESILEGNEVITFTSFYENNYEALPIKVHNDSFYEILQLQNRKIRYLQSLMGFLINLILSFLVGFIFLLVTPFVIILNLFFNKGPLFYTQLRVGQYGKEFKIYKFRSMVVTAEANGAKMATKNDVRITPFGKIMRMFRIDELPQILSVIKGDMKFIGPRPERKVFVEELNEIMPFYKIRHLIKPGITGWAQVMYKYGENLEDSIRKLEYDLFYIKNKSITLDFRIVFKTATTVLFSRGI